MKEKALLSLSGGVDSTVVYSLLHNWGCEVHPYFFRYPSKHNDMERDAASRVAAHYETLGHKPLTTVDSTAIFEGVKSNLFVDGGDIPKSPYTKESLSMTVVPGRNLIFASILASRAESLEGDKVTVALGVHASDTSTYADCRPDFVAALREVISLSSEGKVSVVTPISSLNKEGVIVLGMENNAPFELTRSCYNGGERPCRTCSTCIEREEAFRRAGMEDPILKEM